MDFDKLIDKQKELMDKVPHELRPDVYSQVIVVKDIMEQSLLYLASLGHKPWRPNPLSNDEILSRLRVLIISVNKLDLLQVTPDKPLYKGDDYDGWTRKLISGFGVIEETLEYLDTVRGDDEPHKLEELTDSLFFFLEEVILSGFTSEQIEAEYHRKHAVNLERYRRAEEGDYGWDDRDKKKEL